MAFSAEEIKSDIAKLDEIKAMIDSVASKEDGAQNDDALITVLEIEYQLSAKAKKDILAIVNGKKPKVKTTKTDSKREVQNICGECYKVGVNFNDKGGKFIGFDGLKKRIAQKKNQLATKLK